jgi:hypothetical protein
MILIRLALIGLIVYLLVRSFLRSGEEDKQSSNNQDPERKDSFTTKKVSKKIGEYIDYEEVDRKGP